MLRSLIALLALGLCSVAAARITKYGNVKANGGVQLWTIDHETIAKLVAQGGIVAPKGPAGSMILFHSGLVHGSTSNLSPWKNGTPPEALRSALAA